MKTNITVIESEIAEMGGHFMEVLQSIKGLLPLGDFCLVTGERAIPVPSEWASGIVITSPEHAREIRGEDHSVKTLALMPCPDDEVLFEMHDAYIKGVLIAKQTAPPICNWDPTELAAAISDVAADRPHYPEELQHKLIDRRSIDENAGTALHFGSQRLLRLLAAGLNERDTAREMMGSMGFVETVKGQVKNRLALRSDAELMVFAQEWVERYPLDQQEILEVVRPHPDLGTFYVYQYLGTGPWWSARHYIFLSNELAKDERQVALLNEYVHQVQMQFMHFNFTGGSTIDGQVAPGWTTLKKHWPRQMTIYKSTVDTEHTGFVKINYDDPSESAVKALYTWLDAQFAIFSSVMFLGDTKVRTVPIEALGRR